MTEFDDASGGAGDDPGNSNKKPPNIQSIAGELLRRAVTLGAGAYISAEDTVSKTLNTVQAPIHISKAVMIDLMDRFVENYSMQVTAKIDFVKKKKENDDV